MRNLIKTLLLCLLFNLSITELDAQTSTPPLRAPRRLALIITNDESKYLQPIKSAWKDGFNVEEKLASMHYETLRVPNGDHKRINYLFDSLGGHMAGVGTLLIVFKCSWFVCQ